MFDTVMWFITGFISGCFTLFLVFYFIARSFNKKDVKKKAVEFQKRQDAQQAYEAELKRARELLTNVLQGRLDQSTTDKADNPSVKERLLKAAEITTRQLAIDTRKGHEQQLQYNELELEKIVLLKTILAEGHDPIITIRYNTGDQVMNLSAYVDSLQKSLS